MRKKSMRFISAALAACMMASTLPVGAFALEGDTAPESGVSTQAEETVAETVTTIPTETKVYTIAEGGNYELLGGNYGRIEINMTDTTKPVNITIKGNVAETLDDPLFNVTNAGVVNIVNEGYDVDCSGKHVMYERDAGAQVTITGGQYKSTSLNIIMVHAGTLTVNDAKMESDCYSIYVGSSGVATVNGGEYTYSSTANDRSAFYGEAGGTITLNNVTANSTGTVLKLANSTAIVNGGNFKSIGSKSCFVLSASSLTINEGTTTKGEFESESASCINNRGFVEINGGTFTSGAESTIYNRGGLRMTDGTVTNTKADGVVIDASGNYGDIKLIGGTIKGIKDGIYVQDLGSSEVTLQQVTFEGSQNDIHLGGGQQINIKKTFTGKAKILVDDAKAGRRITQENDDTRYQKDLNLVSNNEGYIVGYKREDGVEYRYLADANGNAVSTQDAKATANLGAGAQQLDTTDVVPEGKDVTVTADLREGAEFLDWSAVRDDGKELDWTPARDDPQTITFTMPDCNVTVTALCQGGNVDPVNPGGGSSDVVTGIAAVALTGAAVWSIYEAGTGIYRVLNMPGVPMPSNRAGLATLIWEKAGCPEPQTVKSFSDIDDADLHLRQAASWMEEQGLMDDVKENEFRPYRYVTKLQTCLVWDKAKEESLIS